MKKVNALFGSCVVGIVICFGMSVYTAIQENKEKNTPKPLTIPLPATPPTQ